VATQPGWYRQRVVTAPHHQAALWRAIEEPRAVAALGREAPIVVVARAEPDNPLNADAIAIESEGGDVLGYLPLELTKRVRLREPLRTTAVVRGGFALEPGGVAHLGIVAALDVR